ncbi:hypothetical protein AX16_010219 [Volvariella volvacea WC 439]|nr:hypothetical protein AX16_010219 [Volvariella volvacea WC 439]
MTLCALLAPECVIVWAIRQKTAAGKVVEKYGQSYRWTKTHGFFIQMGGFILEDQGTFRVLSVNKEGLACIAGSGLRDHRKPYKGVLPVIPEEEIKDKAKGDWLTKLLATVQTTWFVLRCIARWVEGLTLTELELVTLAFAVLSGFTYVFWWGKPMNAEYPIYFKANGDRSYGPRGDWKEDWSMSEMYHIDVGELRACLHRAALSIWGTTYVEAAHTAWEQAFTWFVTWCLLKAPAIGFLFSEFFLVNLYITLVCHLRALLGFLPSRSWTDLGLYPKGLHTYFLGGPVLRENDMLSWGSALVGAVFGGIHVIGWNFTFPSEIERALWRISSVNIMVLPFSTLFISSIINLITSKMPTARDLLGDAGWAKKRDILLHSPRQFLLGVAYLSINISATIVIIFYFLVRLVLFTLALISLRDLPPLAYKEVNWTTYIPHIS